MFSTAGFGSAVFFFARKCVKLSFCTPAPAGFTISFGRSWNTVSCCVPDFSCSHQFKEVKERNEKVSCVPFTLLISGTCGLFADVSANAFVDLTGLEEYEGIRLASGDSASSVL